MDDEGENQMRDPREQRQKRTVALQSPAAALSAIEAGLFDPEPGGWIMVYLGLEGRVGRSASSAEADAWAEVALAFLDREAAQAGYGRDKAHWWWIHQAIDLFWVLERFGLSSPPSPRDPGRILDRLAQIHRPSRAWSLAQREARGFFAYALDRGLIADDVTRRRAEAFVEAPDDAAWGNRERPT